MHTDTQQHTQNENQNLHTHKEHATCLGHASLKPEVHMLFVKKHTHTHTHIYIYKHKLPTLRLSHIKLKLPAPATCTSCHVPGVALAAVLGSPCLQRLNCLQRHPCLQRHLCLQRHQRNCHALPPIGSTLCHPACRRQALDCMVEGHDPQGHHVLCT